MASIGNLAVTLSVNSGPLAQGLGDASRSLSGFTRRVGGLTQGGDTLAALGDKADALGGKLSRIGNGASKSTAAGLGDLRLALNAVGTDGASAADGLIGRLGLLGSAARHPALLLAAVGAAGVAAFGAATAYGVTLAAQTEDTKIAFEVMLGSVTKADDLFSQIRARSAAAPLFGTGDLASAAQRLLGFGVSAEKVMPTLRVLSDLSAGSGRSLSDLAVIFGQVRAAGRLMGQETLQFVNANIPIISELSKHYGKSAAEVLQMREAGLVSFNDVAQALQKMTQQGGLFFNMTERRGATLRGQWKGIGATFDRAFENLGDAAIQGLGASGLLSKGQGLAEWARDNAASVKPLFDVVGQGLGAITDVASELGKMLAPAFQEAGYWLNEFGLGGINVRKLTLAALEPMVGGVAILIDILKIAGGVWARYFAGPAVSGLGEIANALSRLLARLSKLPGGDQFKGWSDSLRDFGSWAGRAGNTLDRLGGRLLETNFGDGPKAVMAMFQRLQMGGSAMDRVAGSAKQFAGSIAEAETFAQRFAAAFKEVQGLDTPGLGLMESLEFKRAIVAGGALGVPRGEAARQLADLEKMRSRFTELEGLAKKGTLDLAGQREGFGLAEKMAKLEVALDPAKEFFRTLDKDFQSKFLSKAWDTFAKGRSPLENFQSNLRDLDQMFKNGLIGVESYRMGVAALFADLEKGAGVGGELKLPGAVERGTAEAVGAALRFQAGGGPLDAASRVSATLDAIKKEAERQNETARDILEALKRLNLPRPAGVP